MYDERALGDVHGFETLRALILGVGCSMLVGACGAPQSVDLPDPGPIAATWHPVEGTGDNLLVLTLDTVRQDRLGCYGNLDGLTPNLDALAARGVVFEDAISPVPVTLPSHATIFTGFDPPLHRVRANGTFVLEPKFTTLAEILAEAGYATGATIASVPVEGRFGLEQGFASYDDDLPASKVPGEAQQRRAAEITDLALRGIEAGPGDRPFFHWAHYYDPHFPYDPPEPYRTRIAAPYDAEIAYMDAEIGRLVAGLEVQGLLDDTWIVIVADHGEALMEHGEPYHSLLLYRATQDVPFLLVPPVGWDGLAGTKLVGRRVPELVRLQDVTPTIVNLLGFPAEKSPGTGATLVPLLAGEWDGPAVGYMESLVPYLEYGWCELRGVRTTDWTYLRAPERELYALASDPREEKNLHAERTKVADRLEQWCAYWSSQEGELEPQELDRETMEQLRSLGYIGSSSPVGSPVNDKDPKKLMGVFQTLMQARGALAMRNPPEARRLLESALRQDPGNPEATRLLGATLMELGLPGEAVKAYTLLHERNPGTIQIQLDLAQAHLRAGNLEEGAGLVREVLAEDPNDAVALELYPRALARLGRPEEAQTFLAQQAENAPGPAERAVALVAYARFEWEQNRRDTARTLAEQALAAHPEAVGAHTLVGLWWWDSAMPASGGGAGAGGNAGAGSGASAAATPEPHALAQARAWFVQALAQNPRDPQAGSRMARILQSEGRNAEALQLRLDVAQGNPTNPFVQIEAGQSLEAEGRGLEALAYYDAAYRTGYAEPSFLVGYGVALGQAGARDRAREVLQRAAASNPSPALQEAIRQAMAMLAQQP